MARGTDGRVWPWGNDARRLRVHTTNSPAPVDVESSADLASPYGLFHMQSNLAEWTADAHDAAAIRRVVMGRSWSRHANALRVFGAESEPASLRTPDLGFRLVADLLP
jgi:formylglycine-generating enzyme required for sulfatase activity